MKLKPNIKTPAFFEAVQACSGSVFFETEEGDNLNLKSTLAQYIFATVIAEKLQSLDGCITIQNPEDAARLHDFFC